METRIKKHAVAIDYDSTRHFFDARISKYNARHPYTTTSYQDKNPELAAARDAHEKKTVLPLLGISGESRILDIGCGVGRWADTLAPHADRYLGVDFSQPLIELASRRFADSQHADRARFQRMTMQQAATARHCDFAFPPPFTCVIISGVMAYLNDDDVVQALVGLPDIMADESLLYIREPIGLTSRLTLSRHYSDELEAEYSAIYRTVDEYLQYFGRTLCMKGFALREHFPLLPDKLTNRAETSQQCFLLTRQLP